MLLGEKAKIQAFLDKYLTNETDIVLTGAGTSAFIGDAKSIPYPMRHILSESTSGVRHSATRASPPKFSVVPRP